MKTHWTYFAVVITLHLAAYAPAAVRTHAYQLDGTYADQLGGPALVPNGGGIGVNGYFFNPGQGPTLPGAMNPTNYSVELVFYIKHTQNWKKLLDFAGRASDTGLYAYNGLVEFYPVLRDTNVSITAGEFCHLVTTRSAANNVVTIYVNGAPRLTFTDSGRQAVISGGALNILRDDTVTASENPIGFLDRLQIFDGPLSPFEVQALHERVSSRFLLVRTAFSLSVRWTNLPVLFHPQMAVLGEAGFTWTDVPWRVTTNGFVCAFIVPSVAQQTSAVFRLVQAP